VNDSIKVYRLLIFAGYFYPHLGGSEQAIYELSKRLAIKGHKIDIITCNIEHAPAFEKHDGFCIYRLPSWDILNGSYPLPKPTILTFRILWKLLREKHDLINTNTRFMSTSCIGAIFATIKRIPLVHTEHGATHSIILNKFVDIVSKIYDHTIGTFIVKTARRNIGVSTASCDFLRHLGARESIVIPNGIDTTVFKKSNNKLRTELGIESSIVLTFVGRLIYAKGVHDLIFVFKELAQKFDNLVLLIVGDGPYRQELEELAKGQGRSKIRFFGEKDQHALIDILSITDIFINPSYSEGFGLSVLEAGAMGIPVVATHVGGVTDIVEDYKTGLLVPPGDREALREKISEFILDTPLRQKLAENAQNVFTDKFDWGRIVADYEKIYREIIEA
jgi:glycosyltransferase involved in cell wall biosynthesis